MESKVLQTKEMTEHHTGVHITELIEEATKEWKISDDKIVAIVHDNTAK